MQMSAVCDTLLRSLIILAGLCAPLSSDQAQYIYDDLSLFPQVIDWWGNVAMNTYDAVGYPLSITPKTGGVGAPMINGFMPNTVNVGTSEGLP
jgi:hypothetical protein